MLGRVIVGKILSPTQHAEPNRTFSSSSCIAAHPPPGTWEVGVGSGELRKTGAGTRPPVQTISGDAVNKMFDLGRKLLMGLC